MGADRKNNQKVPFIQKICYGLCEGGEAFSWTYASMYLMYFWTDVMGISMVSTAFILLLTRLWDGVSDALIGVWIDRTQTRWGKFRPWILFSCVPTGIVNVLCFLVLPINTQGGKLAYGLITFCTLIFSYSCENVAQNALPAAMTLDDGERASLATFRTIGGYGGSILVSNFSLILVERFGSGNDARGFFWTTVLYGFIMVILFVISFKGTREVVPVPRYPRGKVRIHNVVELYRGNRPMLILTVVYTAMGLFTYGRSAVAVYYFRYLANDRALHGVWASVQMLGSIIGTFFVPWLTKRFHNKAVLPQIGWSIGGGLMIFLFFLDPTDPVQIQLLFILQLFIGIFLGVATTGVYSMTPDITEYTQHLKGYRYTGSIAAAVSFFNKCGMALGTAGSAWILGLLGYAQGADQSPLVLEAIRIIFTLYPGIFALVCVGILRFYTLDRRSYREIVHSMYDENGLKDSWEKSGTSGEGKE